MRAPSKLFYWLGGTAIALIGVAVARWLGPQLPDSYQIPSLLIGATIAVIGLFVVAAGAGKKL